MPPIRTGLVETIVTVKGAGPNTAPRPVSNSLNQPGTVQAVPGAIRGGLVETKVLAGGAPPSLSFQAPASQFTSTFAPSAAASASIGRAIGIDLSAYEGVLNPSQMTTPLDFAILKASEGINTRSEANTFQGNYAALSGRVPMIGAYHYLRTDYPVGDQVKAFLNATQGKNLAFLAVDVENQQGGSTIKTPGQLSRYSQQALDFVAQLKTQTTKPVFLYTNGSIYNSQFKNSGLPLWISWPTNNPKVAAPPSDIAPANAWKIWQANFGAPTQQFGISPTMQAAGVDFDVFNGSAAQMQNYLASLKGP